MRVPAWSGDVPGAWTAGCFDARAVFADTCPQMMIGREEVFGPDAYPSQTVRKAVEKDWTPMIDAAPPATRPSSCASGAREENGLEW